MKNSKLNLVKGILEKCNYKTDLKLFLFRVKL